MTRVRQAAAVNEPKITYDLGTGRFALLLDGEELIALRRALRRGVDDLEGEVRYLRTMGAARIKLEEAVLAATSGRALSERIEADVRELRSKAEAVTDGEQ